MTNAAAQKTLALEAHDSIHAIPAEAWNRCAGGDNPLVSHGFLAALEDSKSANLDSGWIPRHLSLKDEGGQIQGVVPFYVKTHSWGEYIFDQSWAHAFHHAGGQYYPKGVSAIPFTPVSGARLMVAEPTPDTAAKDDFKAYLAKGVVAVGHHLGVSGVHINFADATEIDFLQNLNDGWIMRKGLQYHWHNRGYADFDDFLGRFTARKRKALRKERKAIQQAGIKFHHLTGAALTPRHWDRFYHFYLNTIDKKWGGAYLSRDFFDHISQTMAEQILLIMAESDGVMIAGALNFIGTDTLYGRNWGCQAEVPFLHFETCYYQAIDYAIAHGLQCVEAGAQGMHKIQRGYEVVETWSAHYLYDEGFADAIAHFTHQEAYAIDEEAAALQQFAPYRRQG